MRITLIGFFLILLAFSLGACSSEGTPCGNTVCGSGEVCESGECVLGIFIEGDSGEELCQSDEDCPGHKVCTLPNSDPASTCITELNCEGDSDCQSGLNCGKDKVCR